MDTAYYRQVPYRFFSNDSNADACKLEKLTNLFPEMKSTIELEFFKITNLTRTVERLSSVYTILTALDIRDDTLHLFLGPYHLSLGPALFAAFHFKHASAALLSAAHSSTNTSNSTSQRRSRRREAVLRRFRRVVRKLGLVKSIVDQLRPASILTPFNQYELQINGIYDLVLAGRIKHPFSTLNNDEISEQIKNLDLTTQGSFERNPLLISNFTKINHLLNLLTPPQQQQQQDTTNSGMPILPIKPNDSTDNNQSQLNKSRAMIDTSNNCCFTHRPSSPYVFAAPRQQNQTVISGSPSRRPSTSESLKTPSLLSRQNTANSQPESTGGGDTYSTSDRSSSTSQRTTSPPSNPIEIDLNTPTNLVIPYPWASSTLSSSSSNLVNDEEALINRISSLLTSHLLSRQSTTTLRTGNTSIDHETNSNLSDSAISLSTTTTTSNSIKSTQSPIDNFEKILQRIKINVDHKLVTNIGTMRSSISVGEQLPISPIPKTSTLQRRQQLLALHTVSCQEEDHTDDFNHENDSPKKNNKLGLISKSQSLDGSPLNDDHNVGPITTTTIDSSDDNIHQMTTDSKAIQTDPRIRHVRSRLLETLQAYINVVRRHREHLFNQYNQSDAQYEQHYVHMSELQQYEYRDLLNVRNEILNRFEWVIVELEQTIESLQARRLTVVDAQKRVDRPLVKEVIESSLNADLPSVDEPNRPREEQQQQQRTLPTEDEWQMYTRDLQDTKEDLYIIDSLVHRGISKLDRLVNFTNLYT